MTTNPTPAAESDQIAPTPSGDPVQPASPALQAPSAGTNALAIAALVCGILGFTLVAAVLAVIFGILALRQLERRPQSGKGLAIAGIVLGALSIVGYIVVFVALGAFVADRGENGEVTGAGVAAINDLRAGDCFDAADEASTVLVTAIPCAEEHTGQVAAVVELTGESFPGADEAFAMADEMCAEAVPAVVQEDALDSMDLFIFGPETAEAWDFDRSALCVLEATNGEKLTATVLN